MVVGTSTEDKRTGPWKTVLPASKQISDQEPGRASSTLPLNLDDSSRMVDTIFLLMAKTHGNTRKTWCDSQLLSPSTVFLITAVEFGSAYTSCKAVLWLKSQPSKKSLPSLKTTA